MYGTDKKRNVNKMWNYCYEGDWIANYTDNTAKDCVTTWLHHVQKYCTVTSVFFM